jgi:hypothetical protein
MSMRPETFCGQFQGYGSSHTTRDIVCSIVVAFCVLFKLKFNFINTSGFTLLGQPTAGIE